MAQAGQQAVAAGLSAPAPALASASASAAASASSSSAALPLPSAARTSGPSSSGGFAFPHYYYFPPMFTLQPNLATRRAQMDKWTALVLAYCRHYRIFRLVLGEPASGAEAHDGPVRIDGGVDGDTPAAVAAAGDSSTAATANNNDNNDDDDDDGPRSVPYYAPDLFRNRQIDRALTPAAAREVLEAMRQEGRAEWVGAGEGGSSSSSSETASAYIYWKTPEEWAVLVDAWIDDTAQRGSVLTLYELTAGDATRGSELHGLDPVVLQRALAVLVKRGRAQVFGSAGSLGVKFF